MVVEADGSFYPCDFYVLDHYKIGNIMNHDLFYMEKGLRSTKLLEESLPIAAQCQACSYYMICKGGCRRHREPILKDKEVNLNKFCRAYKQFLTMLYRVYNSSRKKWLRNTILENKVVLRLVILLI